MAPTRETRLVFECGVIRFDASANLFVHLTHSVDAPHAITIDGAEPILAPARERRAKVAHSGDSGPVTGAWPEFTSALPRGLVVEVRGYENVHIDADGALVVVIGKHEEMPLWFEQGKEHLFRSEGERVRMWDKSSRPDIQKGRKSVAKKSSTDKDTKKTAPKKAVAEKAAPKKAAAKKAAPKKAAAKKAVAEKAAPKKAEAKKAAPKKAEAKKAAPKKAEAKKAAPKKAEAKATSTAPPAAESTTSSAADGPASQWAGAEASYASEDSRSYDTGESGPLGCLSLMSAFTIGAALLLLIS